MKHPNKEKLQNYTARRLSSAEMTAVILHLENCADCFDALQKLSPFSENQIVALLSERADEVFHLDYDEHLRPFVDNEADDATREIVAGHTRVCAVCAFQLRELREFGESLRLREIEKNLHRPPTFPAKIGEWLRQISQNFPLRIVLPLLLMTAGVVGSVWFLSDSKRGEVEKTSGAVERKSENQTAQILENPVETNQTLVEAVNRDIGNRRNLIGNSTDLTKTQTSANREKSASETEILDELDNLPIEWRGAIQKTLQSQKLTFPAFLPAIRENINLRGQADGNSNALYPKGEAVRGVSPKFRWQPFAAQNEKYVVEIFDEKNDSVAISPVLNETSWTPKTVLRRGKNYSWQVRSEKPKESQNSKIFAGKFKVLEQSEIAELNRKLPKSAFFRGVIFASQGLLTEAETAFRTAIKNRENAELARKLLLQIKNQK
ncbi:MAG: zf-HC2 domain-containing protein [Pyrinomonadaceae bacterium]|nr:zf-HC2 domain-containing protein [Pyrinomonadaceae bacterium]